TGPGERYDDAHDGERLRLADDLLECGRLDRLTVAEAEALLGRPARDQVFRIRGRLYWEYHLSPDGLGIDSEVLSLKFGRSGRVVSAGRAQT
ncbi:MAG: hypothetical protein M3320_08855, partial [Actinomycetota bacterium]|nr:hypothetical protein [Actinomycetota bacterium]